VRAVEGGRNLSATDEHGPIEFLWNEVDAAIASVIDHTILRPDATRTDVMKVCAEARQYGFASVCVNPHWVPLVKKELAG